MNETRYWEIVYPYISRIVEMTNGDAEIKLKTQIENIPNITLKKDDTIYQNCNLSDDDIAIILIHIDLMRTSLLIGSPQRLTEQLIKSRLTTCYKFVKASSQWATATPMNEGTLDDYLKLLF
jgi:hypothetical protein